LDIKTKSKTIMLLFGILLVAFSVFFFISQLFAWLLSQCFNLSTKE